MTAVFSVLMAALVLTGCASGPTANPRDPLEPLNRRVYQFNDAVDTAVLVPVATAYKDVVPSLLRRGVNNFFGNLQDAWSFVNNTLQFKGVAAADSLARFGVNTVWGLGGVLDVASEMQIPKKTKDFGHTLGYWGVEPGPYLVLPLLGPSTLRDTAALPVDRQGNIAGSIDHVPTRNSTTVVNLVDRRASLLDASSMLEQIALDKYTFIRDVYLQSRRNAIYDGNPPEIEDIPYKEEPYIESTATAPMVKPANAATAGTEKVTP
jgi:phospholipid-binding lipoprotein MlaA